MICLMLKISGILECCKLIDKMIDGTPNQWLSNVVIISSLREQNILFSFA